MRISVPHFIDKVRAWFSEAAPPPAPAPASQGVRVSPPQTAPRSTALPPATAPRPAPVPAPATMAPTVPGRDDAALRDRLRNILGEGNAISAGSVHLLGLDALREKLGARWEAVSGRVFTLTERLLRETLSPHDVFFRHETGTYVVVFARLGSTEAQLVCGRIVADLRRILLGEDDTTSITVRSSVRVVGGGAEMRAASLDEMMRAATDTSPAAVDDSGTGRAGGGIRGGGHVADLVTPPPHWAVAAERKGALEIMYRPAWDAVRQVLSLYIARPCHEQVRRRALWGYEAADDPADPASFLALDLKVLREAVDCYVELYQNRFRFFLCLPVHFESVAITGRRQHVIALAHRIPAELRPFLTFQLDGLPAGIPEGRLRDLVNALAPFGRCVGASLPVGSRELPTYAAAGVREVATSLPSGMAMARLAPDLAQFAATAQKLKLRTILEGVDGPAQEQVAEAAGINFLAGDYIGAWTSTPEHVVRKSRGDFRRAR